MGTVKRQHEDVVSSVIERMETMTREEWQERLDRVAERFQSERPVSTNGTSQNGTHAQKSSTVAKSAAL
jgi:hypothetical protein